MNHKDVDHVAFPAEMTDTDTVQTTFCQTAAMSAATTAESQI